MRLVSELPFVVAGVIFVLVLMRRSGMLSSEQKNRVATAVFGLFFCGRYAALIDRPLDWGYVIAFAGLMGTLAYNNLGFSKPERI